MLSDTAETAIMQSLDNNVKLQDNDVPTETEAITFSLTPSFAISRRIVTSIVPCLCPEMADTTSVDEVTSAALATSEMADREVSPGKLTTIRIYDHLRRDDLVQGVILTASNIGEEQLDVRSLVAVLTNMPQAASTPPTTPTSLSTPETRLTSMPIELWDKILSNLEARDLAPVRLTCQGLRYLATPMFFSTFIFRPHLHSASPFNQGFQKANVKKLRFATGTVGIRSAASILGSQYKLGYNFVFGGDSLAGTMGEVLLGGFRQELDAAIKEYVEWNLKWHSGQSDLYQSQNALHASLQSAPGSLDTIEICQKVRQSVNAQALAGVLISLLRRNSIGHFLLHLADKKYRLYFHQSPPPRLLDPQSRLRVRSRRTRVRWSDPRFEWLHPQYRQPLSR